jgi:hypothetical protein
MKYILIVCFCLFGCHLYAQDLNCEEFKNGSFIVKITEPFEMEYKVNRIDNLQTETLINLPQELKKLDFPSEPQYGIVRWIDDCSYNLKYDQSKTKLDATKRQINDLGGILVEVLKIEGNCYFIKSTLKNGEEIIIMESEMCKI